MKAKTLLFMLFVGLLAGCATNKDIFYWGDYSESLYAYKKNPDDKTLAAHKKTLLDIITVSPKQNRPVPPGVYAEYGYLIVKEGKQAEGLEYLNKEETQYPESKIFVERLKQELQGGKK
ncbi:MAG: DUF4810 domain-containing protein [Ignavibacteriales bacterium]|nr:DUF4810 domain-containing protein [Ignavibacteriales bacterium]